MARLRKPQRSTRTVLSELSHAHLQRILLTPPTASLTTSTKDPLLHRPYNVAKLTPCCSSEYAKVHVSCSCSLAGNSNRISSARALESRREAVVDE